MNPKSSMLGNAVFLLAGIFVGFIAITQYHSYAEVRRAETRDRLPTTLAEAQVLYEANAALRAEIDDAEAALRRETSAASAAAARDKEVRAKRMLAGTVAVRGEGLEITVRGPVELLWFVDMINELSTAGAAAIGINGRRVTAANRGVQRIEGGRLMLGDAVLIRPYRIAAIGDAGVLQQALEQEGGVLKRLRVIHPDIEISVEKKTISFAPNTK